MTTIRRAPLSRALTVLAGLALASPALSVSTTIANGTLYWTDREGTVHGAGRMYYEIFDLDDVSGDDLLQTGYAGLPGNYSLFTNEEDGAFDSQLEVYVNLNSTSEFVGHATNNAGDLFGARIPGPNLYWPINIGAGTGSEPVGNFGASTFDNDTDFGRLVGVFQAADFHFNYFRNKGMTVPNITVKYDPAITVSSMGSNVLNLRYTAWDDWDVIFHELGHHIAEHNDFDYRDPVSGAPTWADSHDPGRDQIAGAGNGGHSYGAEKGTRLAWGEGIATALGMLALHDGDLNAAIPNLPAKDRDHVYRSNTAGGAGATRVLDNEVGLEYSVESNTTNFNNSTYRGEGDEWSVSNAIWDFHDNTAAENYASPWNVDRNDGVTMTGGSTLAWLAGSDTFRDFWGDFTVTAETAAFKTNSLGLPNGSTTEQALAIMGEILEEHAISATPFTKGIVNTNKPVLQFVENNYGHSDKFRILVFDANWDLFDQSGLITDTDAVRFSNDLDFTLNNPLTLNAMYHWVVLSTSILDNAAPLDDLRKWYWSGANTITYIPSPGVATLLGVSLGAALRRRPRPNPLFAV